MSNFPTVGQIDQSANSGAAVAQSAIQWKKHKGKQDLHPSTSTPKSPMPMVAGPVQLPTGKIGRKYRKLIRKTCTNAFV
jgi:RNA-binding protein 5/10